MSNHYVKYKSLFSTTLSSGISTGTGETITPNSVSGLPTDAEVTLTFDRVNSQGTAMPSKLERIRGTISGGNLTSYTRGVDGTTEQSHDAGAVIEMIVNAADWNDQVDGILTEHNQDGTHKSALVTTLKASGSDITTGTSDTKIVTPKAIKDAADGLITLTDVTTNDVSTSKHGFVPKAPNDTTKFLRGDGSWQAPGSSIDGWTADTNTWTYVSSTSFKVSGVDVTTQFTKGTRIKLTQTTAKYFVVVSSSFSTDTTVTVTGGTDYTVANAAITSPYYSYQLCPQGYPTWFNYSPTIVGFSANPTNAVYRFKVEGVTCTVSVRQGSSGTSNATNFTISLPITAATISNAVWLVPAQMQDNGTNQVGAGYIVSAGTVITMQPTIATANFTSSGSKANPSGFYVYEI